MKALLLSPYKSHNYGTVLQAFALQNAILSMGVDCEYLNWSLFNPTQKERLKFVIRHPLFLWNYYLTQKKIKNDLRYDYLQNEPFKSIVRKNDLFCDANIRNTTHHYFYDEFKDVEKEYDTIIVGSDQTWSPNILYKYTPYYLDYIKEKKKKNAYAPSIGSTTITDRFLSFLAKNLRSFNYLSCRDRANCTRLSEVLNRNVQNVLDPTLLLPQSIWAKYMEEVPNMPPKYILCYVLGEKKNIYNYAFELGSHYNIPVYYIQTRPIEVERIEPLKGIGCQEFLWLIANCQYLVTDSFHGTIFSINFNRNFVSFNKHEGEALDNGRITDIISTFHLESHFHTDEDYRLPEDVFYEKVNEILNEKRDQSISFLQKMFFQNN